jgi:DNA-binding XRE family transcriptional regulator
MKNRQFFRIRHRLGKTQKELASLLCISLKAVQSFEQGWRKIPPNIERQILFYLFWETSHDKTLKPCWKVQNCPTEWRNSCAAWQHKAGSLCWFINGTFCQGSYQEDWRKKLNLCRKCEVFKENMPMKIM